MGTQYGFFFDADRCINCHACELACKAANNLELYVSWRKVIEIWGGEFPEVTRTFISVSCLHCEEPPCEQACPNGAIKKRPEDGIVVVDKEECTGCGECYYTCPYQVPQFGTDGLMQKCDYCLGNGGTPACTEPCPADALFYGTMEELTARANGKNIKRLSGNTGPSMYITDKSGIIVSLEDLIIG